MKVWWAVNNLYWVCVWVGGGRGCNIRTFIYIIIRIFMVKYFLVHTLGRRGIGILTSCLSRCLHMDFFFVVIFQSTDDIFAAHVKDGFFLRITKIIHVG